MDVIIDQAVHDAIIDFYEASKRLHITLDEETISKKMKRIYDEIENLGLYATAYNTVRLRKDWIQKGYKECVIEDFHFAYQVYQDENGNAFVYVHDACHSFLYRE